MRSAQQNPYLSWVQPHSLLHDEFTAFTRSLLCVLAFHFYLHFDDVNVFSLHRRIVSLITRGTAMRDFTHSMLTNQALAPASIFSLALAIYTGFTIPIKDMPPWFRWLNYLNPVAYAFEALMINEVWK